MNQSKSIVASKTVWGSVVMLVFALYAIFTGDAPPPVPADMPDVEPIVGEDGFDVNALIQGVGVLFGWLLAVYGRIVANKQVTITGK